MDITAQVTSHDEIYDSTVVATSTGHELQYGGREGDGYCYGHQSFDCLDHLTPDEQAAIQAAWTAAFR